MISTRRSPLNFTAPLVLEPPGHSGLSPIALVPGRHLVGTASDCGIRLRAEGVQDRHVLILVGENRTVVKSMDSRTWVNDGPVTEMALRAGDRLSVGPVTFRVRSATREESAAFVIESPQEPILVTPQPQKVASPVSVAQPVADRLIDETAPSSHDGRHEQCQKLVVRTTDHPADTAPSGRDVGALDLRLDEIEQRLMELKLSNAQLPPTASSLTQADLARWSQQLLTRDEKLQQRADQIDADSQRLQERIDLVAERETQADHRHQQLSAETDRMAAVAQSARQSLADEHARHVSVWEEWEAAYQRMTSEIATQLGAIEQQRVALKEEADRLAVARAELQYLRVEQDQERQIAAAERTHLANGRVELASLKSQLDAQRRRLDTESAENRTALEAIRSELNLRQDAITASELQLDRERQALAAERSEQIKRIEQESQQRTAAQTQLDEERSASRSLLEKERHGLDVERLELQRLKQELDSERETLAAERRLISVTASYADSATPILTEVPNPSNEQVDLYLETAIPNNVDSPTVLPDENKQETPITELETIPQLSSESATQALDVFGAATDWTSLASGSEYQGESSSRGLPNGAPEIVPTFASDHLDNLLIPARTESNWAEVGSLPLSVASAGLDVWGGMTPPIPVAAPASLDPWAAFAPASSSPESRAALSAELQSSVCVASTDSVSPTLEESAFDQPEERSSGFAVLDMLAPEIEANLNANDTLTEVNREFGTQVEESSSSPTPPPLPSWWVQNAASTTDSVESEHPKWVTDALRGTSDEPQSAGNDLRSQLANLFDIPSRSESEVIVADEPATQESQPTASEDVLEHQQNSISAAPEHQDDTQSHMEDSVEEFMARLLARSRGADEVEPATPSASTIVSTPPAIPAADSKTFTVAEVDHSHLMAEPKHKQDKQAVRENLQSFRQVAHLSARSALARHSLQQLRNATIAKGILLAASSGAVIWFILQPLFGGPWQLWKAAGCLLAAVLSALEFHRSWSQLMKPLKAPAELTTKSAADGEALQQTDDSATDIPVTLVSIEPKAIEAETQQARTAMETSEAATDQPPAPISSDR